MEKRLSVELGGDHRESLCYICIGIYTTFRTSRGIPICKGCKERHFLRESADLKITPESDFLDEDTPLMFGTD